jgi:hypothetical protein
MGCALKRKDVTTPKLPPPAADRPEKVRVFVSTRCNKASVGEDHVHRQKIINGKAALARQMAYSAAKRETAYTGR